MSDYLLGQARRMREAGNYSEAARLYGEILRIDPSQFEALYWIGLLYYRSMRLLEAERFLNLALGVDPYSSEAWFTLACVLQKLNRMTDAVEAYDQSLAV